MTTYDNSDPVDGWHVPTVTFCARLIGDDRCDCVDCQIAAHALAVRVATGDGVRHSLADVLKEFDIHLDGRGEN